MEVKDENKVKDFLSMAFRIAKPIAILFLYFKGEKTERG